MAYDHNMFKNQIKEDIDHIREDNTYLNGETDPYVFNHWIISNIFNEDDDLIPDLITDRSDDGIDCYVHYEDEKILYIIQNKYYDNTRVTVEKVNTFLDHPLTTLQEDKYKKSKELQQIYNNAIADSEYKIFMLYFTTDDAVNTEIDDAIKEFNKRKKPDNVSCGIYAGYYNLDGIHDLYFGRNYNRNTLFNYDIHTINKHTALYLQNENESLNTPYQAYYIVTPIIELYKMLREAKRRDYAIFDQNMREYLGEKTSVNNGIIKTLKDSNDRKFFLYYNNGVTIICQNLKDSGADRMFHNMRKYNLQNPQIINGCQTVSSIEFVLDSYPTDAAREEAFKDVYVIVKALIVADNQNKNKEFYKSVVRYSNRQNSIPEKAFVSNEEYFKTIQDEFEKRGFLLAVKPSDKISFKQRKSREMEYVTQANRIITNFDTKAKHLSDIIIDLDKLLQVFVAFMASGYVAFTKKKQILEKDSEIYKKYSSMITDYLNFDDMIKLYWLYNCAEKDKKKSSDKRTPVPYYVIGFMGTLIGNKSSDNIKQAFAKIFNNQETLKNSYKYLCNLTKAYCDFCLNTEDYNNMIKRPINEGCFNTLAKQNLNGREFVENWIDEKYK